MCSKKFLYFRKNNYEEQDQNRITQFVAVNHIYILIVIVKKTIIGEYEIVQELHKSTYKHHGHRGVKE